MSVRDLPRDRLVVVPLDVMQQVADYLGSRPFREVAPLALRLHELTTVREYLARPRKEGG